MLDQVNLVDNGDTSFPAVIFWRSFIDVAESYLLSLDSFFLKK